MLELIRLWLLLRKPAAKSLSFGAGDTRYQVGSLHNRRQLLPFLAEAFFGPCPYITLWQRVKTMRAVKSRDTSLERIVSSALHEKGLRYRRCVPSLPGKPDFVFARAKVVVFVDGDFWHGWRFPKWSDKLQPYWRKKIERTRRRDRYNFQRLRRKGWKVLRFWSHQIDTNLNAVIERIVAVVTAGKEKAQEVSNGSSGPNHLRGRG